MVGLNPDVPRLYHARVLLFGESRVGKTALAESFVSNGTEFPKNYSMTAGIRLNSKIIPIPNTNDSIDLLLVDCGGAAVYHDFRKKALPRDSLICFVFDVTKPESLDRVSFWYEFGIQEYGMKGFQGVLVANKCDLDSRRYVMESVGRDFAQKHRLHYIECSAKTNQNVQDLFAWLAAEFYKKR